MPVNEFPSVPGKVQRVIHRQVASPRNPLPFTDDVLTDRAISDLILQWERDDRTFAEDLSAGVSNVAALDKLGVRLCLADRNDDAVDLLCSAVVLVPEHLSALNNLAVVLDRLDRTADAVACVERSLEFSPAQTDSWIFLATLKQKQNDLIAATSAYETALQYEPVNPLAWQGLGLIFQQRQMPEQAIACLRKCLEQNHITGPLLAVLGQLFYTTGQFEKSHHAYAAAVDCDPKNDIYRQMRDEMHFVGSMIQGSDMTAVLQRVDLPAEKIEDLLHKTFALLGAYGHKPLAIAVAEKRVELFPMSATAHYLLCAIRGDATVPRSPDAYLIESFNRHADRFDDHLVNTLGYRIPEKLAAILATLLPPEKKVDLLDAGCGTGLCGLHVRPLCTSLTGIDLADKMIDRARERAVYDHLACTEITSFLNATPHAFDVILAADVLIYFGDLTDLASAMTTALRPGGLLLFSIERADENHPLLTSGRFAHDPAYIRRVFATDFVECHCEQTGIRLEGTAMVPGNIFAFRRS
jgi:predicted TPR repeat methyltransferase